MKKKKRGAGGITAAAIAVLALLLGLGPGIGFGSGGVGEGEGSGGNPSAAISVREEATKPAAETETQPSEEAAFVLTVPVSVLENGYIYQNRSVTMEEFLAELDGLDVPVIVEITDENASLKAYTGLTEALSGRGYAYTEK